MSEIPERIEREMFEIRSRMAPDVVDLRRHLEPKVVAEQVKQNVKQRLRGMLNRATSTLKARQQKAMDSARHQFQSAQEAGRKRNPGLFTDAVKSDPLPPAILAILLAIVLTAILRANNRGGK